MLHSSKITNATLTCMALIVLPLLWIRAPSTYGQEPKAMSRTDDPGQRNSDIYWPKNLRPETSDAFAHNQIFINAPCSTIWMHLIEAPDWPSWYSNSRNVRIVRGDPKRLGIGSRFLWTTFDTDIDSTIHEFIPNQRIGWYGKGKDVVAYHTWLLYGSAQGCLVVTEEAGKGPGAIEMRVQHPNAMHDGHQLWLESLKRLSESKQVR